MTKAKDAAPDDPVSQFETDMKTLEALVQQLEQSDLPLDQSIALFEQGMALSQRCRGALDTATQRVETLTRPSDDE
ncbi:exodeoxyribonuclease VII small subunit [Polycyclovorans algicola]|uniref:exodeoxyribonuclease VII small subunit n=1 Tax=Polycyclovorans algicola TaxID=616992 RepID=UPI0004A73E56|nr:exodeoxyribonuclease VII small subunit [Polycyclovorans algicola]